MDHMLKGRDSLIPEVPRSRHNGWNGQNVKPFMQEIFFNRMVHNVDRHVKYKGDTAAVRPLPSPLPHLPPGN